MSEEIKKTESLSPEENQETENVSVEEQKTEFKAEKKSETDITKEAKTTSYGAVTSVFEWVQPLLVALVCVTLLLTFVFRQVTVSGSSMYDTLENGDRLIVTNMFYEPQVGDLRTDTVSDDEETETFEKYEIYRENRQIALKKEQGSRF